MKFTNSKSPIVYHFIDENLEKTKKAVKDLNLNPNIISRIEQRKRNEKIRGYLEKRFYRSGKINKELYRMVGGNLKFLGL